MLDPKWGSDAERQAEYLNEFKKQTAQELAAIKSDKLKPSKAMRLLDDYERGLKEYTYLTF